MAGGGGPSPAARATVRGQQRLEIVFPAVAYDVVGCEPADSVRTGLPSRQPVERFRRYQWYVTAEFPGSRDADVHFMGIYAAFWLPDGVPLTPARLDSAFAATQLTVDEAAGEPPVTRDVVRPARARAWRDGARVRFTLEGVDAVGAFLRPAPDSVSFAWCQRDVSTASATALLERR